MNDPIRQLAEITKTLLSATSSLIDHAVELVDSLVEQLPPVEEPEEPEALTVTAAEDTVDTTRMSTRITWDNAGSGENVTIDWGAPDVVDDEEPATGNASYKYTAAGTYTVKVTDLEDESRTASTTVTVPYTA